MGHLPMSKDMSDENVPALVKNGPEWRDLLEPAALRRAVRRRNREALEQPAQPDS